MTGCTPAGVLGVIAQTEDAAIKTGERMEKEDCFYHATLCPVTKQTPPVSSTDVASGHYRDNLETCLSRIPSNSTDSQRMLAKVTCQRDGGTHQSIEAAPGN